MIPPDDLRRLLCDGFDAAAAEYELPLRVEAVSAAGKRPRRVNQTRAGIGIQERADHRRFGLRGIADAPAHELRSVGRQIFQRGDDGLPLLPAHPRNRSQPAAALVAALVARPVAALGADLPGPQPNGLFKLD